jgi:hypothetical protein
MSLCLLLEVLYEYFGALQKRNVCSKYGGDKMC